MGPVLEGLGCGSFGDRVVTSAEVTVSKIFPAGAGWQLASYVAEGSGFSPTSLAFFATVGLGDCAGLLRIGFDFAGTLCQRTDLCLLAVHPRFSVT